jgi:hypothetical protein
MSDGHRGLRAATILVAAVLSVPVTAAAQEIPSSFDRLRELVTVGDDVIVRDVHGRETRGSIREITASSLGLLVDGRRTDFTIDDLETVGRRDSRWNGTLLGGGIAAVLGALFDRSLVKEYGRDDISVGDSVGFIVGAAGVGAGIGFAIDAMIKGTRVLYSRSQTSTSGSASLLPIWGNGRRGVLVSVRLSKHDE